MIHDYVTGKTAVTIDEISTTFGISIATVHRDLIQLEQEGMLNKVRGGAIPRANQFFETSFAHRMHQASAEKALICKYAARFLRDNASIMLDNSTTVFGLVRYLRNFKNLTVITYFQEIIIELSRPGYDATIVATGGELSRIHRTFVGPIVETVLKEMHADVAFISAPAISPIVGIMHPFTDEYRRKRLLIECSNETNLLVDHTKFNRTALNVIAPLDKIKRIITDRPLEPEVAKDIEDMGVELYIASED